MRVATRAIAKVVVMGRITTSPTGIYATPRIHLKLADWAFDAMDTTDLVCCSQFNDRIGRSSHTLCTGCNDLAGTIEAKI